MSQPITMPALSDTMGNGRLVKWVKKPGDAVHKGDIIAEVETDKAVMEVEAYYDGYLSAPLIEEGTEAPVGQIIGYIADDPSEVERSSSATSNSSPTAAGGEAQKSANKPTPVSPVLAASMPSPAHRPK